MVGESNRSRALKMQCTYSAIHYTTHQIQRGYDIRSVARSQSLKMQCKEAK